jgi:hypothetical protein
VSCRDCWELAAAGAAREPRGDDLAEHVAPPITQDGPNFQHLEVLRIAEAYADRAIPSDEAVRLFFACVAQIAELDTTTSVLAIVGIPGDRDETIAALENRVRALCAAFAQNFGDGCLVLPPEFRARAIGTIREAFRRLAELAR